MTRKILFSLFFIATFLQAGAYGLTFMLPKLFGVFGANEKDVGLMLIITAVSTIATVYFSGHLSDKFGRVLTLSVACFSIATSLALYAYSDSVGWSLTLASMLLGFGWGLTYTLIPIVLVQLIENQDRVKYFALLSVFIMAGFGLSPVMAAVLEDFEFSIATSFYFVSILCFVAGLIFLLLVSPIKTVSINKEVGQKSKLSISSIGLILKSKALLPIIMVCLGASVFAGMNNFQTVFAEDKGLQYSWFFLSYTITVVVFRIILVKFKGGSNPYRTIALLQTLMFVSVVIFYLMPNNQFLYVLVAVLFGLGYGVSYPILVAMAANDADEEFLPQCLQLFSLTYFIGIFGFPLIAGYIIVEVGTSTLLIIVAVLAFIETSLAFSRSFSRRSTD